MVGQHTEQAFENAIEHHLTTAGGYVKGDREGFDPHRAIFPAELLAFIKATQPDEWAYLEGLQKDKAEETLLENLCRALDSDHEGCLSVLRHGFKCFGKRFYVAYFAPASGMNPETQKRYEANRLTVTRRLRYSPKHNNTLDVTLATAELKEEKHAWWATRGRAVMRGNGEGCDKLRGAQKSPIEGLGRMLATEQSPADSKALTMICRAIAAQVYCGVLYARVA